MHTSKAFNHFKNIKLKPCQPCARTVCASSHTQTHAFNVPAPPPPPSLHSYHARSHFQYAVGILERPATTVQRQSDTIRTEIAMRADIPAAGAAIGHLCCCRCRCRRRYGAASTARQCAKCSARFVRARARPSPGFRCF